MNTLVNFIKGLFVESKSDVIGLARFSNKEEIIETKQNVARKKDCTLTEMLRRTY